MSTSGEGEGTSPKVVRRRPKSLSATTELRRGSITKNIMKESYDELMVAKATALQHHQLQQQQQQHQQPKSQEPVLAPSHRRRFKALEDREYFGPNIKLEPPKPRITMRPSGRRYPIYLGPTTDATSGIASPPIFYDIDYVPVTPAEWDEQMQSDCKEHIPIAEHVVDPENVLWSSEDSFPQPDRYDSFLDFEQAVLDWQDEVRRDLGYLELPKVLGRVYSRPHMSALGPSTASLSEAASNKLANSDSSDNIPSVVISDANESVPVLRRSTSRTLSRVTSTTDIARDSHINKTANADSLESSTDTSDVVSTRRPASRTLSRVSSANDISREATVDTTSELDADDSTVLDADILDVGMTLGMSMGMPWPVGAEVAMETDPWEALLVPPEPNPEYYDTYEDYKNAFDNWAIAVASLPFLPPHARQFGELIYLTPATDDAMPCNADGGVGNQTANGRAAIISTDSAIGIRVNNPIRVRSGALDPLFDDGRLLWQPQRTQSTALSEQPERAYTLAEGNIWEQLPTEVRDRLHREIFGRMLQNRKDNKTRFGAFSRPILPIIHGTLPRHRIEVRARRNVSVLLAPNSLKPLRRTDLTGPMIAACMDCPGLIDDIQVEFRTPQFELDTADLRRLMSTKPPSKSGIPSAPADEAIVRALALKVRQQDHAGDFDWLNSWYHPLVGKEQHAKFREEFEQCLRGPTAASDSEKKTAVTVMVDQLIAALQGRMFLDSFQELLSAQVSAEIVGDIGGGSLTYSQLFLNTLSVGTAFRSLLAVFHNSSERLTHAKAAALVLHALQTPSCVAIVQQIIEEMNVPLMEQLSRALLFFAELPVDIFAWSDHIEALVNRALCNVGEPDPGVRNVMTWYHVSLWTKAIEAQSFAMTTLTAALSDARKQLGATLATAFAPGSAGVAFLTGPMFDTLLLHRSREVSGFFLFFLLQLLHCNNTQVQDTLRSAKTDLIGCIRRLAVSQAATRLRHVAFAVRRLWEFVSTNEQWRQLLFGHYRRSKVLLTQDLMGITGDDSADISSEYRYTLLSELLLETCTQAVVTMPPESLCDIDFVLSGTAFHALFRVLCTAKPFGGGVLISKLLAIVAKRLTDLKMVIAFEDVRRSSKAFKAPASGATQQALMITPVDLQKIINFVHAGIGASAGTATFSTHAVEIKNHVLSALRYLLKSNQTFQMVRKEDSFYSKLVQWCKELIGGPATAASITPYSLACIEFNRNAWRLFFQLIRYHPGTLEIIDKHPDKLLLQLFEVIGTNQPVALVSHALHYLHKLFRGTSSGVAAYSDSASDKAYFEKDVKLLGAFFANKHQWVKVHMIYKKIASTKYPGPAVIPLARLYEVVATSPHCKVLLKDTQKNSDYKDGIQRMTRFFSQNAQEKWWV